MKSFKVLFQELIQNYYLIHRLSVYDNRKMYVASALGALWHLLNPIIQIATYYVIFGLGIRGGQDVNGIPFFLWMVCGIVPWFFTNQSLIQGANSIHTRLNMVSKMKFPLSVIPISTVVTQLYSHFIVLGILIIVILINGSYIHFPNILFLPYYVFSLTAFLFSVAYITSTLSTVSRDFYIFFQSLVKILFYATPILWTANEHSPAFLQVIIRWNPLYYIVEGYRESLLHSHVSLFLSGYTVYFWTVVVGMLLYGSYLHMKFRRYFVDYM